MTPCNCRGRATIWAYGQITALAVGFGGSKSCPECLKRVLRARPMRQGKVMRHGNETGWQLTELPTLGGSQSRVPLSDIRIPAAMRSVTQCVAECVRLCGFAR